MALNIKKMAFCPSYPLMSLTSIRRFQQLAQTDGFARRKHTAKKRIGECLSFFAVKRGQYEPLSNFRG